MRLAFALTVCFLALVTLPFSARANNNFFMPGDAFFPTSCTQEELDIMAKTPVDQLTFRYSSYGTWQGAFCGNAGFSSAQIVEMDAAFLKNIAEAYAEIRKDYPKEFIETDEDGKTKLRETNPVRILFYRQDFPYKQRKTNAEDPTVHLGIRYNENWVEETVKFGHQRNCIRMCPLIPDPNAIAASWRDATAVDSLDIEIPEGFDYKKELTGEANTSVAITGKIKAIVLPPTALLEYYRMDTNYYALSNEEVSLVAYIVDSNTVEKKEFVHDPWEDDEDLDE